jgi:DNA/RNA endonuclease YhcR with UshA esterase domain
MKEKQLIKVSLIVAIVGLLILFFFADSLELTATNNIENIENEQEVKLQGTITRLTQLEKVVFIELEGKQVVKSDVILFPDEEIYLQEGNYVEIIGTIEEYNNKKEVIANEIILK